MENASSFSFSNSFQEAQQPVSLITAYVCTYINIRSLLLPIFFFQTDYLHSTYIVVKNISSTKYTLHTSLKSNRVDTD